MISMDSNSADVRETAGGVVLNQRNEVLVTCQRGDAWSLPKGGIDAGETAREAAEREIYEETGVTGLQYVRDLGVYERHKIGKGGVGEDLSQLKRIHMFLYRATDEYVRPVDPHNTDAKWVSEEDVAGLLTHKKDGEFFTSLREQGLLL